MKVLLCVVALLGTALAAPGASLFGASTGGRIIGGSNAVRGEFPQIVTLQYCILSYCQHSCGATILSPSWLVTAAHCITELPGIGTLSGVAGILHQNDANAERRPFSIKRRIIHPDYKGGVNPHDIALLELTTPLQYNDYVLPARLPPRGEYPQGQAMMVGWGSTGGIIIPQMPNTLQKAPVPIVSIPVCDNALTEILNGALHPLDADSNFCTGPLNERITACGGDSGGPIFQDDTLIGIVSWGISPCGLAAAPSVQVRVSTYIDWIQQHVDEPLLL